MLAKLVKESMEYPALIKKIAGEMNELQDRFIDEQDPESREKLRNNIGHTERELECLRSRQAAAVATINLLAALIGAGKAEDAQMVLAALSGGKPESAKAEGKPAQEKAQDQEELKSGLFSIKGTTAGKKEGTVWATATADGAEYKICAKNGVGKTLMEAAGKQVRAKYRSLGGNRLFAVSVEIAG